MRHTYHLTDADGKVVVVFEGRSVAGAIETADTLDPDSKLLMSCAGPTYSSLQLLRVSQ